jgi:uncharacterized protein YdhG (YjbR/CyaY superfamily)
MKMLPSTSPIDAYIAGFPGEVRDILQKVRTAIRRAAPGAEEAMAYGIPTFCLNGTLVHFAAFKGHIGFYPTPGGIDHFRKELAQYTTSKGAVRFPWDRPVPYALIGRITRHRVKENLAGAVAKKNR